jgi:hypothetical protein
MPDAQKGGPSIPRMQHVQTTPMHWVFICLLARRPMFAPCSPTHTPPTRPRRPWLSPASSCPAAVRHTVPLAHADQAAGGTRVTKPCTGSTHLHVAGCSDTSMEGTCYVGPAITNTHRWSLQLPNSRQLVHGFTQQHAWTPMLTTMLSP